MITHGSEYDKEFICKYLYLVGYAFKYVADEKAFLVVDYETEIGFIEHSISEYLIRKNIDFTTELLPCRDNYSS